MEERIMTEVLTPEKIAQKVQVNYTPAKVDVVGLANLKQAVDQVCKTYSGLVVTADSYKQDKKTTAELNKLKKALNDRKIEIKKQATKEVDQFSDEVKAMTSEIDGVVSQIRVGINAYDEKAKAERTKAIKRRISDLCSEAHVSADDIEWDPSWANKSSTWPKTEREVKAQIVALQAKYRQYAESVKAVTNRAAELDLPESHWIEMLNYSPLSDVLSQMGHYKEELAQQKLRDAERRQRELDQTVVKGNKRVVKETGEVVAQVYHVRLELCGSKEQLAKLLQSAKDLGLEIKRL
ncbi:DUF1351 domain-containing protein [Lactobacillus delbrueckii]|nr:DUF1351 domain-containing protein [Lactobacillus delbrueckii]